MIKLQITNYKLQTNRNHQNFNDQNNFGHLVIGIWCLFVIWCLFIGICFNSFAEVVSSTDLINNAKQYDGKTVTYQGEVIGEVMARGEFAWANVNDTKNAIGIWLKKNLTKEIVYAGNYKTKGDIIEVSGVFNRACVLHGGDLDIHAQSIRKISSGEKIEEKLDTRKKNLAIILFGVLLCLCLIKIFKKIF